MIRAIFCMLVLVINVCIISGMVVCLYGRSESFDTALLCWQAANIVTLLIAIFGQVKVHHDEKHAA